MSDPNAPPPAEQPSVYPPLTDEQQQPPPQAEQATTTVVVTTQQPTVAPAVVFGDVPVTVTDSAGNQVQTQLQYKSGMMTFIIAIVLFFLGFWCCCCIPFCIDATKDVVHINPTDGSVVGVYKRIG